VSKVIWQKAVLPVADLRCTYAAVSIYFTHASCGGDWTHCCMCWAGKQCTASRSGWVQEVVQRFIYPSTYFL